MTGAELITAERDRQINEEGWTAEHDQHHFKAELALAAATYIIFGGSDCAPLMWPFASFWWKPGKGVEGRIRSLAKAGALCAAEIDRIKKANIDLDEKCRKARAEVDEKFGATRWPWLDPEL